MKLALASYGTIVFLVLLIAPTINAYGLIVPLYIYPGSDWTTLINLKNTYPNVPIIAVINPGSGPGTAVNSDYTNYIGQFKAANITVIGYVYTSYGSRTLATVQSDIGNYSSFYPTIDGVFFDQMQSSATGYETYYQNLTTYARSRGFKLTVGNPGAALPISYLSTVNITIVYAGPGISNLSTYSSYSPYNSTLGMIAYNVSSLPTAWVNQAANLITWIYVTPVAQNPYQTLSTYLANLTAQLSSINNATASASRSNSTNSTTNSTNSTTNSTNSTTNNTNNTTNRTTNSTNNSTTYNSSSNSTNVTASNSNTTVSSSSSTSSAPNNIAEDVKIGIIVGVIAALTLVSTVIYLVIKKIREESRRSIAVRPAHTQLAKDHSVNVAASPVRNNYEGPTSPSQTQLIKDRSPNVAASPVRNNYETSIKVSPARRR